MCFLCCIFTFPFKSKVYRLFSCCAATLIIAWHVYLLISQKRTLHKSALLCNGFISIYMSLLFLYSGYALICNEEKPGIFLLLFLVWACFDFIGFYIIKKRRQQETHKNAQVLNTVFLPAAALGYFGAKILFPHIEHKVLTEGIIIALITCAFFLNLAGLRYLIQSAIIRRHANIVNIEESN